MANNNFKLISSSSISATNDSLVNTAAVASTMVIHSVYLTNVGSNLTYANVKVTDDSSSTSTHVAYNTPISSGDTLILDKPLNLETGDSLYVRGATLEVTVSALEIS
jgi:hypothetical protein